MYEKSLEREMHRSESAKLPRKRVGGKIADRNRRQFTFKLNFKDTRLPLPRSNNHSRPVTVVGNRTNSLGRREFCATAKDNLGFKPIEQISYLDNVYKKENEPQRHSECQLD